VLAYNAERWNAFLPWLVIVAIVALFASKKMYSICWVTLRRLGYIDLFFAISFWEIFGGFLIIANGFRNMLINSVLQS